MQGAWIILEIWHLNSRDGLIILELNVIIRWLGATRGKLIVSVLASVTQTKVVTTSARENLTSTRTRKRSSYKMQKRWHNAAKADEVWGETGGQTAWNGQNGCFKHASVRPTHVSWSSPTLVGGWKLCVQLPLHVKLMSAWHFGQWNQTRRLLSMLAIIMHGSFTPPLSTQISKCKHPRAVRLINTMRKWIN